MREYYDMSPATGTAEGSPMTEQFVKMPLIRKNIIAYRKYQVNLAEIASKESTLIILSTGLGKTVIAALVAAKRLTAFPESKIVFLAPSRPLVDQQARFLRRAMSLSADKIVCLTGQDAPETRKTAWEQARIIVMTPQSLQNDLIQNRYDLKEVSLMVYDEAHRGVGNYAYTFIAEMYERQGVHQLSLGLTASPGHKSEQIEAICKALRFSRIESRTEKSPDVREYIVSIDTNVQYITLTPEIQALRDILFSLLEDYIAPIRKYGYSVPDGRRLSRKEVLELQRVIRRELGTYTKPPRHLYLIIRNLTAALRIIHLLEFIGTQGLTPTLRYINGVYEEIRNKKSSKGVKDLVSREEFRQFEALLEALIAKGHRHPKADLLLEIVNEQLSVDLDSRILIFTRFRDTAVEIVRTLEALPDVRASRFIGQSSKTGDKGFSQKKQVEILDGFRNNEFNVLVATQVGEEGLDIPECNLVIFYDCVPSVVPYIQRRGRTGRHAPGRVVIFVARNTHDEFYHWSVISKLKRMPAAVKEVDIDEESQSRLDEFIEAGTESAHETETKPRMPVTSGSEGIQIIVDSRELPTAVPRELTRLNVKITSESLEVGDYIISEDVAVERKESGDFVQSLIDGRLFTQLIALKSTYTKPVLIIEGEQIIGLRAVNPASIYGALASIAIRLQIPILWTRNAEETANMLYRLARFEQLEEKKTLRTRAPEAGGSDAETLEYILAGFPGVDTVISRALLTEFGTLEKIFNATAKELQKVKGVGPRIANRIKRLLRTKYRARRD